MEFRANKAASRLNSLTAERLTKNLSDKIAGLELFDAVKAELGNAVEGLPYWHPILAAPPKRPTDQESALSYSDLQIYSPCDHTYQFVRGMLTCPYSRERAIELVEAVNEVPGLAARLLNRPLYSDDAHPVLIEAEDVHLEADGTIRSRDALGWFLEATARNARAAGGAETWWNIRGILLGHPHGARSSLVVNDFCGRQMRKILETLNDSGVFGPILEESLDMLTEQKRNAIAENLLRAGLNSVGPLKNLNGQVSNSRFELRGENCNFLVHDTWADGYEYQLRVTIGERDLTVAAFYYPGTDKLEFTAPTGKRKIAEKFI